MTTGYNTNNEITNIKLNSTLEVFPSLTQGN